MTRLRDVIEAYRIDSIRYHQKNDGPYEVYMYKDGGQRKYEVNVETVEGLFECLMERIQVDNP